MDRYQRQILLPQIGPAGQAKIAAAVVMLVGVGALGCTVADQLCRAGVGKLILIDRDIVDSTNLHRQTLFTTADANKPTAKASAAAAHCRAANSDCDVIEIVGDVGPDNILRLIDEYRPTVLIDSTDNVGTRFLLNDAAIARSVPLIYGGCVGTEGRAMTIIPGVTPCLRCIFPTPPGPAELPTCDTAGILGPAAAVIGAIQASEALRLIVTREQPIETHLISIDLWSHRYRAVSLVDARRNDCVACVMKQYDFLNASPVGAVSLCGRNTVQIRIPVDAADAFLSSVEAKLQRVLPSVDRNGYLVRGQLDDVKSIDVFIDGRVLVHGTSDLALARSIVSRYLG